MPIRLDRFQDKMTIIQGGKRHEISFEIRNDPLTGTTGRVYYIPFHPPKRPNIEEMFKRSEGIFCPFCPENIENATPRFPEELIPEGKIRKGRATLIPNPFPLDRYVGLAIFSPQHFVRMEELKPELMRDGFLISQEFIRRVAAVDAEVDCFSINWNFMPQAGSSLVHPHLQVLCGARPTNHMRSQLEAANRYYQENESEFWDDFMRVEKEKSDRYLGEIGPTFWTVNFVPISAIPDVWCIFSNQTSLLDVGEEAIDSFLEGLSAVLDYYRSVDIFSFNVGIFSFRFEDHFRVNARILSRLVLRDIGNSDYTFLQAVHEEHTCYKTPEEVCQQIKAQGFGHPVPSP